MPPSATGSSHSPCLARASPLPDSAVQIRPPMSAHERVPAAPSAASSASTLGPLCESTYSATRSCADSAYLGSLASWSACVAGGREGRDARLKSVHAAVPCSGAQPGRPALVLLAPRQACTQPARSPAGRKSPKSGKAGRTSTQVSWKLTWAPASTSSARSAATFCRREGVGMQRAGGLKAGGAGLPLLQAAGAGGSCTLHPAQQPPPSPAAPTQSEACR